MLEFIFLVGLLLNAAIMGFAFGRGFTVYVFMNDMHTKKTIRDFRMGCIHAVITIICFLTLLFVV